jgi:hypothetical protein
MTSSTEIELLIGLAIVVYIGSKQLSWRPVDPGRMFRMPLILGVAGVLSMAHQNTSIRPVDVTILALSAVFALLSGALMGRVARFRRSAADPLKVESRAGWAGLGIWVVLIAIRVALDVAGHRMGSDIGVSTGSILLVLALNRLASALVVSARQPHRELAMAGK